MAHPGDAPSSRAIDDGARMSLPGRNTRTTVFKIHFRSAPRADRLPRVGPPTVSNASAKTLRVQ